MEEKLRNTFDALTMPEGCAKQIESKLHNGTQKEKIYCAEPVKPTPGGWVRGIAAAALVLCVMAVGMLLRPDSTLHAADPTETTDSFADRREDILEQYWEEQERLKDELGREQERYREELEEEIGEELEPGHAATVENIKNGLRYPVGSVMYSYTGVESAGIHSAVSYDTSLHTPWTVVEDGRVMFILDKTIDITDLFSEEEPFTYIYTDIYYITHYIAIGGTVENPGFVEMTKFCWETDLHEGNLGGFGANTWNSETESRYEWVERAKEIFEPYGVYWVS